MARKIILFSGRLASKNEIAYARLADSRHHIVLSSTLDKVAWKTTQIVRDVEDIRKMRQQPGKDMYAVGCYVGFQPDEPWPDRRTLVTG